MAQQFLVSKLNRKHTQMAEESPLNTNRHKKLETGWVE